MTARVLRFSQFELLRSKTRVRFYRICRLSLCLLMPALVFNSLAHMAPARATEAVDAASLERHERARDALEKLGARISARDADDGVGTLIVTTDSTWGGGDDGLVHLKDLQGLYKLRLGGRVTDAGLAHVAPLTWLTSLDIHVHGITDEGIAHLSGLKRLQRLNLTYTRVTDAGLQHLAGMTELQWLGVSYTLVTADGVDALQRVLADVIIQGDYRHR